MNTTRQDKRGGADILYKVDPKKLSIKVCYACAPKENVSDYTTTFESFSYEKVKVKMDIPEKVGQLPAFVDGFFYFGTEEEAQDFVRKQIGM